MREVAVDLLREELFRVNALLTQTRVLHPCGQRLHGPAELLTPLHVKSMTEAGLRSVFFLEPGELESACTRTLAVEMRESSALEAGDVVMENLPAQGGGVLIPAGTLLDAQSLPRAQGRFGAVAVRKRTLEAGAAQARQYLARAPMQTPHPTRPDTRLTQVITAKPLSIRPLLIPRARVFVSLPDAFARSLIAGTLGAEGHEAVEFKDAQGLEQALGTRPDVVILDLAGGPALCEKLRALPQLRTAAILVAAPEGKGPEVYKALAAGANGSLALPARRDLVLEGVRAAMAAMGKSARVKPSVQVERRQVAREGAQFACRISDSFLSKPLPVSTATVADLHEGGVRIEYPRPEWPVPWAYLPGSMHPKHFFFNYARVNPLGRQVSLAFLSPGGASMEVQATFIHLSHGGVYETAGLLLQRPRGSVKEHMTTMRQRPTISTRRF